MRNLSVMTQDRPLGFLFSNIVQLSLHYFAN